MSVELIPFALVIVTFLCLIVGVGRVTVGRQYVDQAAAAAARDASLSTSPAQASERARGTATMILADAGPSCARWSINVDTTAFRPGGQVTVTLTCTADLQGVTTAGLPATWELTSRSTSPLDSFRVFSQAAP